MENQFQNEQSLVSPKGDKAKFALIFIINIIITLAVSVSIVYYMQTGIRSDIKELQHKTSYIKIAK